MKLEIADYPVKQIRLSHRFSYENQVLEIDESEIVALVREDGRIEDVSSPAFAISLSRATKFPAAGRYLPEWLAMLPMSVPGGPIGCPA